MLWYRRAAMLVAVMLTACGGGGGGSVSSVSPDNGSGVTYSSTQISATTSSSTVSSGITISGKAQAQIVPNNLSTGRLNYTGQYYIAIRGATVELLNAATSAVLASTTTDGSGNYSLLAPTNTSVKVRVKAEAVSSSPSYAQYNVSIRDNTNGNALYVLDSASFNTGTADVTQNLSADSGWDTSSSTYTGTRASAPFALLDTAYRGMLKIAKAQSLAVMPKLHMFWSINNRPSSGTLSAGDIGTSFFSGYDSGSGAYQLYILGKEGVDTDEFDETVVAHEFGHYLQAAFSRDNSIGGSHSFSHKLDMRVAFSEGWGNAWGGIATGRSVYSDSSGSAQASGFVANLNASAGASKGWFNEISVAYVLTTISQNSGFTAIWNALTASDFKTNARVSSLHSFLANLGSAALSDVGATLAAESIASTDGWGAGETNHGGVPGALPLYRTHSNFSGSNASYCLDYTYYNSVSGSNKLGVSQFIRMTLPAARSYTFVASGSAGTDPDYRIYQSGNVHFGEDSGTTETKSFSLGAGDAVLVLTDYAKVTASNCFNLAVN